ncbi:unnamed protein product [Amoebophrya sp. A120]|nr:unnamed protein product [Amoebophrya sp. A120]|eukprot:GSA120T00020844001.1
MRKLSKRCIFLSAAISAGGMSMMLHQASASTAAAFAAPAAVAISESGRGSSGQDPRAGQGTTAEAGAHNNSLVVPDTEFQLVSSQDLKDLSSDKKAPGGFQLISPRKTRTVKLPGKEGQQQQPLHGGGKSNKHKGSRGEKINLGPSDPTEVHPQAEALLRILNQSSKVEEEQHQRQRFLEDQILPKLQQRLRPILEQDSSPSSTPKKVGSLDSLDDESDGTKIEEMIMLKWQKNKNVGKKILDITKSPPTTTSTSHYYTAELKKLGGFALGLASDRAFDLQISLHFDFAPDTPEMSRQVSNKKSFLFPNGAPRIKLLLALENNSPGYRMSAEDKEELAHWRTHVLSHAARTLFGSAGFEDTEVARQKKTNQHLPLFGACPSENIGSSAYGVLEQLHQEGILPSNMTTDLLPAVSAASCIGSSFSRSSPGKKSCASDTAGEDDQELQSKAFLYIRYGDSVRIRLTVADYRRAAETDFLKNTLAKFSLKGEAVLFRIVRQLKFWAEASGKDWLRAADHLALGLALAYLKDERTDFGSATLQGFFEFYTTILSSHSGRRCWPRRGVVAVPASSSGASREDPTVGSTTGEKNFSSQITPPAARQDSSEDWIMLDGKEDVEGHAAAESAGHVRLVAAPADHGVSSSFGGKSSAYCPSPSVSSSPYVFNNKNPHEITLPRHQPRTPTQQLVKPFLVMAKSMHDIVPPTLVASVFSTMTTPAAAATACSTTSSAGLVSYEGSCTRHQEHPQQTSVTTNVLEDIVAADSACTPVPDMCRGNKKDDEEEELILYCKTQDSEFYVKPSTAKQKKSSKGNKKIAPNKQSCTSSPELSPASSTSYFPPSKTTLAPTGGISGQKKNKFLGREEEETTSGSCCKHRNGSQHQPTRASSPPASAALLCNNICRGVLPWATSGSAGRDGRGATDHAGGRRTKVETSKSAMIGSPILAGSVKTREEGQASNQEVKKGDSVLSGRAAVPLQETMRWEHVGEHRPQQPQRQQCEDDECDGWEQLEVDADMMQSSSTPAKQDQDDENEAAPAPAVPDEDKNRKSTSAAMKLLERLQPAMQIQLLDDFEYAARLLRNLTASEKK